MSAAAEHEGTVSRFTGRVTQDRRGRLVVRLPLKSALLHPRAIDALLLAARGRDGTAIAEARRIDRAG